MILAVVVSGRCSDQNPHDTDEDVCEVHICPIM